MRKQVIAATTLLSVVTATPVGVIAEPVTHLQNVDEHVVVENIKATIDTFELPSKEEVAKAKIAENLKKIEEEKKKADEAARAAEEAKKAAKRKLVAKPVVAVEQRADFSALYAAAGAKFGVNPSLLAAVHFVETGQRGNTTVASYAGAQGPMQFIPSTFRAYAVDGDGDGVANIYDVDDAVFTAAKYLAANGAANGNVTAALLRYNHSLAYVNKVLSIARGFGYNG